MVMDSSKARRKIESVEDLPTLPSVASEILRLANSPKTNAADVGAIIEQDQALTTKVLKLVNSSFYGFPGQIKSIQHAVVIIGFSKVKNVVMSASIFELTKGITTNTLHIPRFWLHALGTAIGAKVSAKTISKTLAPDDAFVGGLVHGIGCIILNQVFPEEYRQVVDAARQGRTLLQAEKEILGFTHCQCGMWIAERWKLPPALRVAVRYYATPMTAREERDMAAAVHLGSVFSRALGIGNPGDPVMTEIDPNLWTHYGLGLDFLDTALGGILAELKLAKEFVNLIVGEE